MEYIINVEKTKKELLKVLVKNNYWDIMREELTVETLVKLCLRFNVEISIKVIDCDAYNNNLAA